MKYESTDLERAQARAWANAVTDEDLPLRQTAAKVLLALLNARPQESRAMKPIHGGSCAPCSSPSAGRGWD